MPGAPRKGEPESAILAATNPDPLASLHTWGITVTLGGVDFVIPALPAARWLELLLAPQVDPEAWFPGLCGPEQEVVLYQLQLDGLVSQEEFEAAIWECLEAVSGRRWWITLRLCMSVRAHWEWMGGALAVRGIRAQDVSLGFWLDAVYALMVEGILERTSSPRRVADWTHALTIPPPQEARASVDEEENGRAFLAAFRAAR